MKTFTRKFGVVMSMFVLVETIGPVFGLDLLPKKGSRKEEVSGVETRYWMMSHGSSVGYRVQVEINGKKAATVKRPGETLEVTQHIHPGLNTVKFIATETKSRGSTATGEELTITIGPEGKRERRGNVGTLYIELKEMPIHYVRPAAHRGGKSTVELHFTVQEKAPETLANRYVLYSQGVFSGHVVHVALNGVPLADIMTPGAHFDLNPFLKPGDNEITFLASLVEGVPFTTGEREKLRGKVFEVGVGTAGEYDPVTYARPATRVTSVIARFSQPADQQEPEAKETVAVKVD